MKLNKMILFALPGVAFPVIVSSDFNSENVLYNTNLFYNELQGNINPIVQQWDIDEVMVVGSSDYTEGIAKMLCEFIPDDNVTVFVSNTTEEGE